MEYEKKGDIFKVLDDVKIGNQLPNLQDVVKSEMDHTPDLIRKSIIDAIVGIPDSVNDAINEGPIDMSMRDGYTPGVRIYLNVDTSFSHTNTDITSIGMVSESGEWFYAESSRHKTAHDIMTTKRMNGCETFRKRINGKICNNVKRYSVIMRDDLDKIKKNIQRWIDNERLAAISSGKYKPGTPATFVLGMKEPQLQWVLFMSMMSTACGHMDWCPDSISPHPIDISTIKCVFGFNPCVRFEDESMKCMDMLAIRTASSVLEIFEGIFKGSGGYISLDTINHNALFKSAIIECHAKELHRMMNGLQYLARLGACAGAMKRVPDTYQTDIGDIRYALNALRTTTDEKEENTCRK